MDNSAVVQYLFTICNICISHSFKSLHLKSSCNDITFFTIFHVNNFWHTSPLTYSTCKYNSNIFLSLPHFEILCYQINQRSQCIISWEVFCICSKLLSLECHIRLETHKCTVEDSLSLLQELLKHVTKSLFVQFDFDVSLNSNRLKIQSTVKCYKLSIRSEKQKMERKQWIIFLEEAHGFIFIDSISLTYKTQNAINNVCI